MATKSKKFSHSILIKVLVFVIMLLSLAGAMYAVQHIFKVTDGNVEMIFEEKYLQGSSFRLENDHTIDQLAYLINEYKSEENILKGNTIDEEELSYRVEDEFWEDSEREPDKATMKAKIKKEMIAEDLENFKMILKNLENVKEPLYYLTDGEHTFTNTNQTTKAAFEKYPVRYIGEDSSWEMYPPELDDHYLFYDQTDVVQTIGSDELTFFVGYTDNYITQAAAEWEAKKASAMKHLYYLLSLILVFILSLLYLVVTTGRNAFKEARVHMNALDKIYVDINLGIILLISLAWYVGYSEFIYRIGTISQFIYFMTLPYVAIVTILLLSMVRHMKNRTFFKHSLLFIVLNSIYGFLKETYNSGSVGMKVIIIVVVYPIVTAATLFFFPLVIALAAWLALKKVKAFQKIQVGAEKMKNGYLDQKIEVEGKGEFATLAANINGMSEGFKQAVHNELKNERMKTELITNVSHDIRTPLTSLITYTDLLKTERDPEKMQEYIEILDQKTKRLKVLTDDLFAAAKASSGDIPVDLQAIDVVALVNQGIGEVSEQIAKKGLIFKCQSSEEKMFVMADGKLLWRSIENILTNIFNYALEGSRVYIDMKYQDDDVLISFKNMSKYELNISEEELMERFKRGDESRASQGSGLGLSITKSLIENQQGHFKIEIDGDLFKSNIYLRKVEENAGK